MKSIDHHSHLLSTLIDNQNQGKAIAMATIVRARGSVPRHAGSKMLIFPDGTTVGTIGGGEMESRVVQEALEALKDGLPRIIPYSLVDPSRGDPGVCGGEVEIFIEPYQPAATVLVIGCGHVGRALAQLASWAGFQVAVTDDRPELASPDHIPEADVYLPGDFETAMADYTITSNTFIAAVTRNVLVDRQILPKLLASPAPYIGVIGSRRRWQETKKLLMEDGLSETEIGRFHSPIGLELQAETPEEIALSIMAEIIMHYRGGTGQMMATVRESSSIT